MQILENKEDYGKLPHINFHPDIVKSTLAVILNTTDDLCVCPGISDPVQIDIVVKKKKKLCHTMSILVEQLLMEKLLNVSEVPSVLTFYLMS